MTVALFRRKKWNPRRLGSSLAAWYKADAGCYTDAACLFASASSQYLSKSSPTFAPTTKMTIAFGVKPTSIGAYQTICARWGGSQNQFIVYINSAGRVEVYIADSLTDAFGNSARGTTVLTAGVQYRVVVVYDGTLSAGSRIAIYLDGVAETIVVAGTIPASMTTSTAALMVGNDNAGTFCDEAVARLGFSSLALSGAALTAAHTSTFWADMTAARQADWFSFYNLCEASSTRVDSTGLNNLTPTNGPTVAAGPGEGACVDNSPCKRSEDQSGLGRHRTQSTIGYQPIWAADFQNGRPALVYDGVDDYLTCAGFTFSQPCAYGFAGSVGADGYVIDADDPQSGRVFQRYGSTTLRMYAASVFDSTVSAMATFRSYVTVYDGASSIAAQDGVEATGDAGAGNGTGVRVGISGGSPAVPGQVNEGSLVLASKRLSAAERASLHAWQKSRFGTP